MSMTWAHGRMENESGGGLDVFGFWIELRPVSQPPADGAPAEAAGPEESAGGLHRPLA